jgi:negative regulator of flagellin synthesis FlgM
MSSFEVGAPRPVSAVQVTALGTGGKPVQTDTPTAMSPAKIADAMIAAGMLLRSPHT